MPVLPGHKPANVRHTSCFRCSQPFFGHPAAVYCHKCAKAVADLNRCTTTPYKAPEKSEKP